MKTKEYIKAERSRKFKEVMTYMSTLSRADRYLFAHLIIYSTFAAQWKLKQEWQIGGKND